jgi:hypothetical protein
MSKYNLLLPPGHGKEPVCTITSTYEYEPVPHGTHRTVESL